MPESEEMERTLGGSAYSSVCALTRSGAAERKGEILEHCLSLMLFEGLYCMRKEERTLHGIQSRCLLHCPCYPRCSRHPLALVFVEVLESCAELELRARRAKATAARRQRRRRETSWALESLVRGQTPEESRHLFLKMNSGSRKKLARSVHAERRRGGVRQEQRRAWRNSALTSRF